MKRILSGVKLLRTDLGLTFLFVLLNLFLFFFIFKANGLTGINKRHYLAAYHYFEDPRMDGGRFDFLRAFGQFDAQWYLRIASVGYPKINGHDPATLKKIENGSYAFFPLYPFLVRLVNYPIRNIELTAFLLSNLVMVVNFYLTLKLVSLLYDRSVAVRTAFLLFLFPFSIFFRSYFTESLAYFLILAFVYFTFKKKYLSAGLILAFLNGIKANSWLLIGVLIYKVFKDRTKTINKYIYSLLLLALSALPILVLVFISYYKTGHPFYFILARQRWYPLDYHFPFPFSLFVPYIYVNIMSIIEFPYLETHLFLSSKLEVVSFFIVLFLLIKSRKHIKKELWLVSVALFALPVLTTTIMSFTRYQIVSLPLFIYAARKLSGVRYYIFLTGSYLLLLGVSLLFVNWFWLG